MSRFAQMLQELFPDPAAIEIRTRPVTRSTLTDFWLGPCGRYSSDYYMIVRTIKSIIDMNCILFPRLIGVSGITLHLEGREYRRRLDLGYVLTHFRYPTLIFKKSGQEFPLQLTQPGELPDTATLLRWILAEDFEWAYGLTIEENTHVAKEYAREKALKAFFCSHYDDLFDAYADYASGIDCDD